MSLVGFKAKNHRQQVAKRGADDGVDERITPPEIFEPLHARFRFTLDAAANAANAKCAKFFTREQDGRMQSWKGETVWCNPPYSNLRSWVEKAWHEMLVNEVTTVMLLPANRCEQPWWHDFIEENREGRGNGRIKTGFLPGRKRFGWPAGRVVPKKGDRPPFGLVVVIFEGTLPPEGVQP